VLYFWEGGEAAAQEGEAMKHFRERELAGALAWSRGGGQSLHEVGRWATVRPGCPQVFKRGTGIAHLFDQDLDRLVLTAKDFGVRVIKVERAGEEGQHIDLCGKPLAKAEAACEQGELGL
jgi:hypothetical protein